MLFVCLPKFCLSIVFAFSWDHCKSQEKLETMLNQSLGGKTSSIMVFSEMAYCSCAFLPVTSFPGSFISRPWKRGCLSVSFSPSSSSFLKKPILLDSKEPCNFCNLHAIARKFSFIFFLLMNKVVYIFAREQDKISQKLFLSISVR